MARWYARKCAVDFVAALVQAGHHASTDVTATAGAALLGCSSRTGQCSAPVRTIRTVRQKHCRWQRLYGAVQPVPWPGWRPRSASIRRGLFGAPYRRIRQIRNRALAGMPRQAATVGWTALVAIRAGSATRRSGSAVARARALRGQRRVRNLSSSGRAGTTPARTGDIGIARPRLAQTIVARPSSAMLINRPVES